MFHCTKRSSDRVKEKVHFRIQFHATQVPHLAWDRLAVFLIPLDTGRVSSKTCKVPVQNGQCHWPRAVSETTKLVLDIRTLKYDEKLYKLVVGKSGWQGSRSDVLGEVITNLTEHISAACPTSVALPLRFCYAGTVLHVTIQCLRDKPESRPSEWQRSVFEQECLVPDDAHTPLLRYNEKCNIGRHSSSFSSAMDEASRLQVPSCSPSSANGHNVKTKSPITYLSLSSPAIPAQTDGYLIGSFGSFITSSTLSSSTGSSFKGPAQNLQNGINGDFEDLEGMHVEAFPWKSYAQRLQAEIEMQEEHFANAKLKLDIEQSFVAESELEHFKFLKQDNEHYRLIIEKLKEELAFEKGANANLNIELQKLRDSNMELHSDVGDLEDSVKMQIKKTQLEEERDAYLLESYVFENLVRELCEQLQTVCKVRDEDDVTTQTQNECESKDEQTQDFICDPKDLRASFSDVCKVRQESEGQIREFQSTCHLLEDRMMKEHGELMDTSSSLDVEFGHLSSESDSMFNKCKDIETHIKQEQNDQKSSMRLSIEEEACEIMYLRDEVQRLKEQTTTLLQENETLASKALVETERHQAEKKEWYDKFIEMEEMLKQSEAQISSTKTEVQELETLDVVTREQERQDEAVIWKTEKQKLLDEILCQSAEVEILKTEVASFMENLKIEKVRLDIGLQNLSADRIESQEQIATLEQNFFTLEAELENCKLLKATLEKQVICLQTKLQVECVLAAEARNDCKHLRKENQVLKCELFESYSANGARSKLEGELLNLQKRMEAELVSLLHETELQLLETMECLEVAYEQSEERKWAFLHAILEQCKHAQSAIQENVRVAKGVETSNQAIVTIEDNISRLQSQLQCESECVRLRQENQGLQRALCDEREHVENLRRNLELLEAELCALRDMAAEDVHFKELESIKQEFEEREALLWKRLKFLEIANEQLAEQQVDSGLKRELTRLQTHNSELIRREDELISKVRTYELPQLELQRLQEENEQLEQKLLNVKEASL